MKNLSVGTFIHLLFSLAIVILTLTIYFFISWNNDKYKIDEVSHYKLIADAFLSNVQLNPTEEQLQKFYKDFYVKPVSVEKVKEEIENEGQTIFGGQSMFGQVRVFETPKAHYIYVQRLGYNLMLQDNRPKNYTIQIAIGIGAFLIILLVLLYLAILKKLHPLKKLHKQIERFAAGDIQSRIDYIYNDEIGKIAKSFDHAILHINRLIASKNLFMRNIMHELKTPITKGRIVVESIDDEATKKILIRAFDRMNELINELAEVERVATQNFTPNIEKTSFSQIVEKAQELLMIDKKRIEMDFEDFEITTDVKLLALALKNLLDNGIKYSPDKNVRITARDSIIEVISKGNELKHPLSFYIEPFSQEEKRSSGFGLGLYIVDSILEKLGFTLSYIYKNGENTFKIKSKKAKRKPKRH
ncbi:MAG: HAMP domain-containing histidine kinase [Campylobacterales bacterium]|nr:HAMP domain-containing histidine kinase [Campylobacterales bacterium]